MVRRRVCRVVRLSMRRVVRLRMRQRPVPAPRPEEEQEGSGERDEDGERAEDRANDGASMQRRGRR